MGRMKELEQSGMESRRGELDGFVAVCLWHERH